MSLSKKYLLFSLIFFTLFFLNACKKNEEVINNTDHLFNPGQGFFVNVEGGFNYGNARIDYYNYAEDSLIRDVFFTQNNKKVGDVLQSMYLFQNKIYVLVNNSNTLFVVNPSDMKIESELNTLQSPRYFLPINSTKAYISDLYENKISIYDIPSNSISSKINLGTWSEKMLFFNDKIFVTCPLSNYLKIINTLNHQVIDSVEVGYGGNSIVMDKNNKLWVLAKGKGTLATSPRLSSIDPFSLDIESSLQFLHTQSPFLLNIDSLGENLYYINNGVYKMSISNNTLPSSPIISAPSNENYYGLNLYKNKIVLMNAKDYNSQGEMLIYDMNGNLFSSHTTGIIPSDICVY